MNRIARRAAHAQTRTKTVDRVTAIHEAGHAVGRLLMAGEMGFPLETAVHSIEIDAGPVWRDVDGMGVLRSQATCFGPAFSHELQLAYRQACPDSKDVCMDDVYARLMEIGTKEQRVRSSGAKMLIIMMGPAAEARHVGKPWSAVFFESACAADRADFAREARLQGLSSHEMSSALHDTGRRATELVAATDVWNAINAVARNVRGQFPGRRIASLAAPFLVNRTNKAVARLAA